MGMLRTKAKTSERIHVYIYFSGLPTTAPTMVLRQIAAICLDLLLSARSLLVQPKRFNTLNKK